MASSWLTFWYRGRAAEAPLKRLIMLAPANHGSKLAATGKSMPGRVIKGFDNWFESGRAMLNDLEFSSSYQWELAQRDLLVAPGSGSDIYYGDNAVWPFVITGTHTYPSLLRKIVNENGSDGTVRVSAANLNARGVTIDFGCGEGDALMTPWQARLSCDVPLAVLPTRTHASIVDPARADKNNQEHIDETPQEKAELGRLILEALRCASFAEYSTIATSWDDITEATASRSELSVESASSEFYHQYMQVNTYVVDDQGRPVNDYFWNFFNRRQRARRCQSLPAQRGARRL